MLLHRFATACIYNYSQSVSDLIVFASALRVYSAHFCSCAAPALAFLQRLDLTRLLCSPAAAAPTCDAFLLAHTTSRYFAWLIAVAAACTNTHVHIHFFVQGQFSTRVQKLGEKLHSLKNKLAKWKWPKEIALGERENVLHFLLSYSLSDKVGRLFYMLKKGEQK